MIKPLFLSLLNLIAPVLLFAQNYYLNTKTPYHTQQLTYTKAPDGYKAVFINYTGRHGARFQTSAQKDLLVADVMQRANKEDALTGKGKLIYKYIQLLEDIERNNYGNITKLGEQEQHDIATRMYQGNQGVFTNGKLLVEMTEKLRTQQSAKAFLSGLPGYDSSAVQSVIFPAASDSILRFYDLSEAYKTYLSGKVIRNHKDSLMNDKRTGEAAGEVCKNLFAKAFISKLDKGAINSVSKDKKQPVSEAAFCLALYDVYASMFSTTEELQGQNKEALADIGKAFPKQSLLWFDMITSASDFYEKGPADNHNGIQVFIAAPLLRDMIYTTDSAIQFKKYNAVLRFTHAEAISPLAALLRIPAASKTSQSVFTFAKSWQASEVIPMSANVQWILYSNGKNYLLKVLLNEKEVALPVITQSYPYYNWNDVEAYYQNKLSLIHKK